MDPQLSAIASDLLDAEQRVRSLLRLPADQWACRPALGRWSAADCVAHLNLTSEALLPLLRAALQQAAGTSRRVGRYRRDPVGWLIWKAIGPAGGLKTRTRAAFEPKGSQAPEALVADFTRLQAEIQACVAAAEGLPIDRVKVLSPFDARVRYNLYAALTLVPRHQHRHLAQAEQAGGAAAHGASPVGVWSRA